MRDWINVIEEASQKWYSMSENKLRAFAAQFVGYATNEMGDPEELSWQFESMFDLDELRNERDWEEFYQYDVLENPSFGEDFVNQDFRNPIVVSYEHGIILWDGNHRVATALHRGDRYIDAVVGRPKV